MVPAQVYNRLRELFIRLRVLAIVMAAETTYALEGRPELADSPTIEISTDTQHSPQFVSRDQAGNVEAPKSVTSESIKRLQPSVPR